MKAITVKHRAEKLGLTPVTIDGEEGYLAYRVFRHVYSNTEGAFLRGLIWKTPWYWSVNVGEWIFESVDTDRLTECSYGIHVATLKWIYQTTMGITQDDDEDEETYAVSIWKVFVPLRSLIIPDRSDGKARASSAKILAQVTYLPMTQKTYYLREYVDVPFQNFVDYAVTVIFAENEGEC